MQLSPWNRHGLVTVPGLELLAVWSGDGAAGTPARSASLEGANPESDGSVPRIVMRWPRCAIACDPRNLDGFLPLSLLRRKRSPTPVYVTTPTSGRQARKDEVRASLTNGLCWHVATRTHPSTPPPVRSSPTLMHRYPSPIYLRGWPSRARTPRPLPNEADPVDSKATHPHPP